MEHKAELKKDKVGKKSIGGNMGVEKDMDKMVHAIEKNQKVLNCLESNNYRRRQKINTLRKDRAVFDKIFKGIEMKILKEEKQMIRRIKSLRKEEAKLEKVKADLEKLEKVIGEDHREKLVNQIQEVYTKNFLDYSGHDDDEEFLHHLTPKEEVNLETRNTHRYQLSKIMSVDFKNKLSKALDETRGKSKYSRSRKFEFRISKDKLHEAIHQKKAILEEMEKKLETLKRLVEENRIDQIEQIFLKGPQICKELHDEFDQTTKEVFELENEEQKYAKVLREIENEIKDLKMEKKMIKEDFREMHNNKHKYQKDLEIRKENRERDDDQMKPSNLPIDSQEFEFWKKKTENLDSEFEKYLGIYTDMAKNTCFDWNLIKDNNDLGQSTNSKELPISHYNEEYLKTKNPEEITDIIMTIENWVNMFVIIQKRNLLGDNSYSINSFKKSPEMKRRGSRRNSRRQSFRKSMLSNQSIKKVIII
jgi:hypothetical protein